MADRAVFRSILAGFLVLVLLVAGLGGWAAYARINAAVIAQGTVVVDSNVKTVQHQEGGIVGEIAVRDGDFVQAGDILVRLDGTVAKANLAIISGQLDELRLREARLEAEQNGADAISVPGAFDGRLSEPGLRESLEGERLLLASRRASLASQLNRLGERISQYRDEIEGLVAQRDAKDTERGLIAKELEGLKALFEKGHVPVTRLLALQREAARLKGESGQLIASVAQTEGRIAETQLQITETQDTFRQEVVQELRDIRPQIAELEERQVAAADQLRRLDIRAPQSGFVHQLAVHTKGGVIAPGDVLMLIVPRGDLLVVEARVDPTDIDQLHGGQEAAVRFPSFNQRTTPDVDAVVTQISADIARDQQTGESFYVVRLGIPEEELEKMGMHGLVPGMPAEVFIRTAERTALSYLVKPLKDHIARAFREE